MRRILLLVVFTLVAVGLWRLSRPRAAGPAAKPAPTARGSEVAIQDGKTLDFSSGKPVVKDNAAEQAAIARAVRDMDAASAGVSFGPKPAPAPRAAQ